MIDNGGFDQELEGEELEEIFNILDQAKQETICNGECLSCMIDKNKLDDIPEMLKKQAL